MTAPLGSSRQWNWTAFEKILALVGSGIAWLVWDGVLFIVMLVAVADSGLEFGFGVWMFAALFGGLPIAGLAVIVTRRIVKDELLPRTTYARAMAALQAIGAVGVVAAVLVPTLILRPHIDPTARISVDNQSQYAVVVLLEGHLGSQSCSDSEIVNPGGHGAFRMDIADGLECLGVTPTQIQFRSSAGDWTCDWKIARTRQPIVMTDDGPSCPVTSTKPGILDQPSETASVHQ